MRSGGTVYRWRLKYKMAEHTIRDLLGLGAAEPHNYSKAVPLDCPDKTLLYGVELEIESARPDWTVAGFEVKADGSLRDNGFEYITEPMTFSNLAYGLQQFFKKSGVDDHNYSERCSTHVHTNVQDLTWDQLATICLLYQIMEQLLFAYVGNDRDKNIFCVPWSETTINHDLINEIKHSNRALRQWQKYTALNLRTIHTIGTIEWRHMEGCHSLEKILNWCRLIGCLYAWARKTSLDDTKKYIINLNSTSEYQRTLEAVFGDYSKLLQVPHYKELLEDGVLTMKYSLINIDKPRLKVPEPVAETTPFPIPDGAEQARTVFADLRRHGRSTIRWARDVLRERGEITNDMEQAARRVLGEVAAATPRPTATPRPAPGPADPAGMFGQLAAARANQPSVAELVEQARAQRLQEQAAFTNAQANWWGNFAVDTGRVVGEPIAPVNNVNQGNE
jgi:hypothetical protein